MLVSTLHDPENRLREPIRRYGFLLKEIFETSYVAVTPSTSHKVMNILNNIKFQTSIGPKTTNDIYREALGNALTDGSERMFYCDFDRILHWIRTHPEELKNTLSLYPSNDFLLIGRTSRAFKTHPETQTMTENIANQIASKILQFGETRDVISACWRFTPGLVEELLRLSSKNSYGFYCEWPITAWRLAENPGYLEVEGLEWETPDRYWREIRSEGYERWLNKMQTSKEWKRRVKLLMDTTESMCNTFQEPTKLHCRLN